MRSTRPFAYYFDGRLFEWCMSVSMLVLSLEMVFWPVTIRASAFQWLLMYMNNRAVTVFMFTIGLARVIALVTNGYSLWIGPRLRSWCALASSVMWFQFGTALLKLSVTQGFPSPGIPFWYCFMIAELYVTYRAVLDVRTRR